MISYIGYLRVSYLFIHIGNWIGGINLFNGLRNYIRLHYFNKKWRKDNPQSDTVAKNVFSTKIVSIGKGTYGPLNVQSWGSKNENLQIGCYCSIATDVKFILGGNHNYSKITTFPYKVKALGATVEAESNGPIIVDSDVWIGEGVTVLSGVHICQGAIIGAGSVVSKNIPPYAIAVGNPVKIIKFRFDQALISELMRVDYSKIDMDSFKKFQKEFDLANMANVKKIVSSLN